MIDIIAHTFYADIFTTTLWSMSTSMPITTSIVSTLSNNVTTGAINGTYVLYMYICIYTHVVCMCNTTCVYTRYIELLQWNYSSRLCFIMNLPRNA